ncbi:MAG: hypothetical protein B7Y02_11000 [Rhodobacterales bacterium 17-64-5]|nr:MAG: hypothetical protein B7Y02_11000 [Rhodobacterales bacterium 17-64-5]HQS71580.1 hypothetical protein [Novosphingobium sp.]
MNMILRLFAMLLVALFAVKLALPVANVGTSQAHDMSGMNAMMMDQALVPQGEVSKGLVDLCKSQCQAAVAVLPQTLPILQTPSIARPQAAVLASNLPSRDFPPEAPPPKSMILPV